MTAEVVDREAARVLLVDPDRRVLLVRFVNAVNGVPFWCPVGGGLDAGETAAAAAVREVREETGFEGVQLGPECFHRDVEFAWHGTRFRQHERWFVAYVPHFDVRRDGWTADERRDITDVRWFGVDDLRACTEALVPLDLAAVFARLVETGPPERPERLGF